MVDQVQWVHKEQDFAEPLSAALHAPQGAKFRLMLASLSPHAPDWQPPPTAHEETAWSPPFAVGVQRPLYASKEEAERQTPTLTEQTFLDWFLTDCLRPAPLVSSTEQVVLPSIVQQSLPHWLVAREQERAESGLREADLVDMLDQLHAHA
ncbi:VC2046/SO_2500 family protein [Aliidiomarina taiwanensis]|nr:VC2046/SO_2500 family protein [Aliidiomarina taiwanensis]